jgi:hypothetical protein
VFCLQAASFLHEDNATYPKKITYAYVAPHLAVEALEVGDGRIHVITPRVTCLVLTFDKRGFGAPQRGQFSDAHFWHKGMYRSLYIYIYTFINYGKYIIQKKFIVGSLTRFDVNLWDCSTLHRIITSM